jgi:hypothetical protein
VCTRGSNRALPRGPSTSPLVVMAQLIGFLVAVALFVAVSAYGRYVFRRFGATAVPWPRGKRLALLWVAIVFTVIVILPAVMVAVMYPLGMITCSDRYLPTDSLQCSPGARLWLAFAVILVGLPLMALWLRFLVRLVNGNASHDD